ncbi:MAG: type II toxin-antitoxin system PemK/MazF family toxin [Gemmatimonadota bacterium]
MKRGDVYVVALHEPDSINPSHVQAGNRPAIIVQVNDATNALQTVTLVPLTGRLKARRFPYSVEVQPSILNALDRPSVALTHQIVTVDKRDLVRKIGELDSADLERLEVALKGFLGIQVGPAKP